MSKYVKKLGSDRTYKRPKKTYQDQLSADEITKKLQGYEKVDNMAEVPLNTHIRYFKIEPDGTQVFRTGGFLYNKRNPEEYIMLSNGKNTWSVQVKDTVFFKKMSQKDEIEAIHIMYKKKLAEKDLAIDKLKKYIRSKISKNDPNITHQQQLQPHKLPKIAPTHNVNQMPSRNISNSKSKLSGSKSAKPPPHKFLKKSSTRQPNKKN
jgi:hypothetical protein